jgi:ribonuclease Y
MSIHFSSELILLFCLGAILGAVVLSIVHRLRIGNYQTITQRLLHQAEIEIANKKRLEELATKQRQLEQQQEIERQWQVERKKRQKEEERLQQREDTLEGRMHLVEKKLSDIEKRESILISRRAQIEEEKKKLQQQEQHCQRQLEDLSALTALEAKSLLLQRMTEEIKGESAHWLRQERKRAEEEAEQTARTIVTTAIHRLAVSCASEATVQTLSIANDEMKGRIIGREGRNIRTLEQETGVNFMIDDTPGAVVLSSYDPMRLHVAKIALTDLMNDGRIYPTRIEEAVARAKQNVAKRVQQRGEDVALQTGVIGLHPELISLLGKLGLRFSYGQNVLEHSLEVSYLMGLMAGELGLDSRLAKRIGLLHDIGKAVSHEVEGTHALIGRDFALKYGESSDVANGIGCHHHEIAPVTLEASLCSAADAISASRPGARMEALDAYIKRLAQLESMALEIPGIEKAYAMQAGREVRLMVQPGVIDDDALLHLARSFTKRIEKELNYPGKIKVIAIREKRITEYAL